MEYVIGPVLSLLIALGYVKKTNTKHKNEMHDALEKIEEVENKIKLNADAHNFSVDYVKAKLQI